MTQADSPERQRRFLIVRLSAIGDTIHSLPLAAALKNAFPGCYVGWVTEKPSAGLITGNPMIDWSCVLPKGWLKKPGLVLRLRRELRGQRFGTAIDPQGLTKSAAAAWLSGAPERIGFLRGEGRELAPILNTVLTAPHGTHAVDRTLSLLTALGVTPPARAEFPLPPPPEADRQAIDAFLSRPAFAGGFVLMGPWGSFPAKLWPLDRFGKLAEDIHARTGLPSAMLGHGAAERGAAAELAARTGGALEPAPDLSLPGVAELARRARLFVGCDSFPMHAAAAAGCRTIGLFGITDPARLGPYGPRGSVVFHAITLVQSTRERRTFGPDNLLALSGEDVLTACMAALNENK